MNIELHNITVRELTDSYVDNGELGVHLISALRISVSSCMAKENAKP